MLNLKGYFYPVSPSLKELHLVRELKTTYGIKTRQNKKPLAYIKVKFTKSGIQLKINKAWKEAEK